MPENDKGTTGIDNDVAARGLSNLGARIPDRNLFGPIRRGVQRLIGKTCRSVALSHFVQSTTYPRAMPPHKTNDLHESAGMASLLLGWIYFCKA